MDFPTTAGAFDTSYNGGGDVVVTKLNALGSALNFSTFLGGGAGEFGLAIAVDRTGNAYVTGTTDSTNFPTTRGAFDRKYNGFGGADAFVTKLDSAGGALAYSTFVGGATYDEGFGIAVDPAGKAFVTGFTGSTDFPTSGRAFDTTFNGGFDAFVTELNAAGRRLVYSTFLGGASGDIANGIALDASGNVYVTGTTGSADFPTTAGAFDKTYNGSRDAFVTTLNPAVRELVSSSFLGGAGQDEGFEIAAGRRGTAYVVGATESADFPTTTDAFDPTPGGGLDAFVTKLRP
jgi:hypothetical protein